MSGGMADALFLARPKSSGIQIHSLFSRRLRLLDDDRILSGINILPNACHLPRDFNAGLIRANGEAVIRDLPRNNSLRELPDDGELITELAVQGGKVGRQDNG